jgi:predicted transcriptional regulator
MAKAKPKPKYKPDPRRQDDVSLARELEAWSYRCRGWNQTRISKEMKLSNSAVCMLLKKARLRVKDEIADYIIEHVGMLDHIIEQCSDSWHKSLEPLRRVRQTTDADGREVIVNEAVEREGSVAYLDRWLAALDRKAKVLGLNVADAQQEQSFTVSSLAEEMLAVTKRYDDHRAQVQAADPGQREAAPSS